MINKDRIVPIQATDLISLYATIINLAKTGGIMAYQAESAGVFNVVRQGGPISLMLAEPVKRAELNANVTSGNPVYLVLDYDFEGFTRDGATLTIGEIVGGSINPVTPEDLKRDGCTLYALKSAEGYDIGLEQVGF